MVAILEVSTQAVTGTAGLNGEEGRQNIRHRLKQQTRNNNYASQHEWQLSRSVACYSGEVIP